MIEQCSELSLAYDPETGKSTDPLGFVLFSSGSFSNFQKYEMNIDDCKYCCCEQYMMSEKQRIFENAAEKVGDKLK